MKKDRDYLIEMYNATCTDDGRGGIETYNDWLEKQLISRIESLEKVDEGIRKTVLHLMDDNLRGTYVRGDWTTDQITQAMKASMFLGLKQVL